MTLSKVITEIYNNPSCLEEKNSDMKKFLKTQGNPDSQGIGNSPTDQESAFALKLQSNGYKFISKGKEVPKMNGNYYFYQPNGTQRNIDFMVIDIIDGITTKYCFDLKHTNGKSFYFNDGWFEDGVIYIVSFTDKKKKKVYIGYGEETRTEKDDLAYKTIREHIKSNNTIYKNTEFLRVYLRLANQYSCTQFTKDFIEQKFNSVQKKISLIPQVSE